MNKHDDHIERSKSNHLKRKEDSMKKKIITSCLVVALLVVGIVGASLAYFTDKDSADNTFTVGNVKIDLTETEWKTPDSVAPGATYDKNPVVVNTGANDAYIRVDVTITDWAAFKAAAAAHEITDLSTIFAGHDENKWTRVSIKEDTATDTATYSYYYNAKLVKDTSTEALFTSVTIPAAFTSADMEAIAGTDGQFSIKIVAHAIQADGFDTVQEAFANYTN